MAPLREVGPDPETERSEYAGRYRLEARLGEGGMGVVHLATSASGLPLAIKIVHRSYAADPEFRARFRQEVAAARRVSGAFTAPVVDADPAAPLPWMATLYVPGPTLSAQVKRNGPMNPAQLRRLTAGLAEALRDIHRAGVIHRDLKPSNVLLPDSGPKVIDFGISRPYDSELRTETGKVIGSPPYMAPEQFQRPREVGPAADVFALGAVLIHAATGRGPFDSESPYQVAYQVVHDEADLTGVPRDLVKLVGQCLAKEPERRPTPDEIMTALLPPSYDAAAFVPAQRRPAPGERAPGDRAPGGPAPGREEPEGDGEVRESGDGTAGEAAGPPLAQSTHVRDAPAAAPGRAASAGRPRRARWAAGAAALLTLATGGVVYAEVGASTPPVAEKDGAAPDAPDAFVPWRTVLAGAAGSVPYCFTATGPGTGTSAGTGTSSSGTGTSAGTGTSSGTAGGAAAVATLYCAASGYGVARLDPADGHVLWSHRDSSASVRSLATGGGPVLVDEPGVTLRAYDPKDGEPVWSAGSPSSVGGPWSAGDTPLIVGAGGEVKGIDSRTGRVRWNHRFAGHALPVIGFHDPASGVSYLYENTGAGNTTLVTAIDAATGDIRWQRRLDGTLTPVGVSAGSLVLKVTGESSRVATLVRYDPEGRTATRIAVPYGMADPDIVVGAGTAYLLAPGGTLVALDIGAGARGGSAERWRLETGVALMSAPVLGEGDRLYFTAADGRLLAVDTRRGNLLGQTAPRLRDGKLGGTAFPHAPVPVGRRVVGTAPDGSVFAVDGSDPAAW
ncbi:serine/threonine-protein kinase [Streptomyces sp. NBC_00247]|uniref:serine/threonine-protein kinase n=1 Tax=Streptomyces sp. NBC_00247 TaxID=2975689 RepID=UPI002E2D3EC3|nr:serine/threonine-protein kinase [Streptomyces sp. NBC_00247]